MLKRLADLLETIRTTGSIPLNPRVTTLVRLAFLLPLALLVLGYAALEYTAKPKFCLTCHYMKPFYDAWKTSKHNKVPCIDCHYPPGLKSALQRKFQASVQVVKYVTKQYGTKPWTEIDDSSCLRPECHAKRLLKGKVDFGGVVFDHAPHLTSFRRVTRLRCTSCHAQIVQGTHMTVTQGTCFLCHFKNASEEPGMGRCTLCHQPAKLVAAGAPPSTTAGHVPARSSLPVKRSMFDHKRVMDRGVSCTECHADVVQGNGTVPKDRCLVCHSESSRLSRYHDTEFMHRNHVTDHKVDCMRCHVEITHTLPKTKEAGEQNCQACHQSFHTREADLYAGRGGQGVAAKPNPMFETRVPCLGCHLTHQKVNGKGINMRGGAAGCMNCHGEEYGRTLARWSLEGKQWLDTMETALARGRHELLARKGRSPKAKLDSAWHSLKLAEANFELVKAGNPLHNMDFAWSLLRAASGQVNQAMSLVGSRYRAPQLASRQPLTQKSDCLLCHSDAERKRATIFGVEFDHAPHLVRAGLDCTACHAADVKPESHGHGRLRIDQSGCRSCHAQRRLRKPHPADFVAKHGREARRDSKRCQTCHDQRFCSNCHGLAIPHPVNWSSLHGATAKERQQVCVKCHQAKFCASCHRGARPASHTAGWLDRHGKVAKRGEVKCGQCHTRDLCRDCHRIELPHPKGWVEKGHAATAKKSNRVCSNCHETAFCRNCHGTEMPHPESWSENHKEKGASWEPTALCLRRCHKTDYCYQCHEQK